MKGKLKMLAIIRVYWRVRPGDRTDSGYRGTSVRAYEAISSGAGLGTFVSLALPLRAIGKFLGVYDGPHNW